MAKAIPLTGISWVCLIGACLSLAPTVNAASLLSNPGFESDAAGQNMNVIAWQLYGTNTFSESNAALAHSGTNFFKVYSALNGTLNYNGCYQDYISGPGATYSADGWAYTASNDAIAGQNQAWIEVTFRDASGTNILALYRSALINTNLTATGGFPESQWNHLQITNQYDINSFQPTNTLTQLVAPPGTVFLRYQTVFQADAANSGGAVYFDDMNIVQAGGEPYGNM